MLVAGGYNALSGIAAISDDDTLAAQATEVLYGIDIGTWGWFWLIAGIVQLAAGVLILMRNEWGLAMGVVIAGLSAMITVFVIFVVPLWAIAVLSLDILVIWSLLSAHEDEFNARQPGGARLRPPPVAGRPTFAARLWDDLSCGAHEPKGGVAHAREEVVGCLADGGPGCGSRGPGRGGSAADTPGGPCIEPTQQQRLSSVPSYEEVVRQMRSIEGSSRGAVEVASAGTSGEGRQLMYATVGDGPGRVLAAGEDPRQRAPQHRGGAADPAPPGQQREPRGAADSRRPDGRRDPDVQPRRRDGEHPPEHDADPDRPQPRLGELRPAGVARVLRALGAGAAPARARPAPLRPGIARGRHGRAQPVPDRRPLDRPEPDDGRAVAHEPPDGDDLGRRGRAHGQCRRRALPADRHHQRGAQPHAARRAWPGRKQPGLPDPGGDLLRGPLGRPEEQRRARADVPAPVDGGPVRGRGRQPLRPPRNRAGTPCRSARAWRAGEGLGSSPAAPGRSRALRGCI